MNFSEQAEQTLQVLLAQYPSGQAALIPILHLAQREFGYLSEDVEKLVAERLGLSVTAVHEAGSFYSMFSQKPLGRHQVCICGTLSCALLGAERLVEQASQKLGVPPGGTTADGKITLSRVECLGSCGTGPVVQVDYGEYQENMTLEGLNSLLDRLANEAPEKPGA